MLLGRVPHSLRCMCIGFRYSGNGKVHSNEAHRHLLVTDDNAKRTYLELDGTPSLRKIEEKLNLLHNLPGNLDNLPESSLSVRN